VNSDGKFFIGVIIAAVLAVVGVIIFTGRQSSQTADVSIGEAYKVGPDDAPVKIIAFEDLQCPHCRDAEDPIEQMLANNKGKVQFAFRHFPLTGHNNAEEAALAAEAAGVQGKFWEMKKLLFETQNNWATLQTPDNYFGSLAGQLNLDLNQFRKDYRSNRAKNRVQADLDAGLQANVNETPTFFINGKSVPGAKTVKEWQKLIDDALAEAKKSTK
jgi:protein-disulfide isomerase